MKMFSEWIKLNEEFDLQKLAKVLRIDISKFDKSQIKKGIEVEKEHDGEMGKDVDVVKNKTDLLKIAIAHLREDPKYYSKLESLESKSKKFKVGDKIKIKGKGHGTSKIGKIGLIAKEPVYAIYFDEYPKKLHKWYSESELDKNM